MEQKGLNTEATWASILEHEGSVQHLDALDGRTLVVLVADGAADGFEGIRILADEMTGAIPKAEHEKIHKGVILATCG